LPYLIVWFTCIYQLILGEFKAVADVGTK
jgi:hypothetical protein